MREINYRKHYKIGKVEVLDGTGVASQNSNLELLAPILTKVAFQSEPTEEKPILDQTLAYERDSKTRNVKLRMTGNLDADGNSRWTLNTEEKSGK